MLNKVKYAVKIGG